MRLSLHIAKRYLFANNLKGIFVTFLCILLFPIAFIALIPIPLFQPVRKLFRSLNTINIISGISVFGIAVGTTALILILSVFNGFEGLIMTLFGAFNPDIKITAAQGKTFEEDTLMIHQIQALGGVEAVSRSLEEIAFFEYRDIQDFGIIKGVDGHYNEVVNIDSTIIEGRYAIQKGEQSFAVLGSGMRNKLSVNVYNEFGALRVYMPKKTKSTLSKPYKSRLVRPAGTFFHTAGF